MSRYDLRWACRHPAGWLKTVWFPALLSAVFAGQAVLVREPVYDVLPGAGVWPLILAWTGGMLLLSTVAPLDERVQAVAAGSLFAVAVLRMFSYGWALAFGPLTDNGVRFATGLMLHWLVIAAVALVLPRTLETAGREMTARAGVDDRGGR